MKRLFLWVVCLSFALTVTAAETTRPLPALTAQLPGHTTVFPAWNYREGSVLMGTSGDVVLSAAEDLALAPSDEPGTLLVVTYLEAERFQKVSVKPSGKVQIRVFVDGNPVKSGADITLNTGTHQLAMLIQHDGKEAVSDPVQITGFSGTVTISPEAPLGHHHYTGLQTPGGITASPDGQFAAISMSERDPEGNISRSLWVLDLNANPVTRREYPDVSDPVFSSDGTLVYAVSGKRIVCISLDTGSETTLRTFDNRIAGLFLSEDGRTLVFQIIDTWKPDRKGDYDLWMEMEHRRPDWFSRGFLFAMSSDGRVLRRLTDAMDIGGFDLRSGRVLFSSSEAVDYYPWSRNTIHLIDLADGSTREIGIFERSVSSLTWLDDGHALMATQNKPYDDRDPVNYYQTGLYRLTLKDGGLEPLTLAHPFTVGLDVIYTRQLSPAIQVLPDGSACFLVTENGIGKVYCLAGTEVKPVDAPEGMIQGFRMTDRGPLYITSAIDRFPTLYRGTAPVYALQRTPGTDMLTLSPYRDMTFTSTTGYTIYNTLIYPAHYNPEQRYPLIVFFYGGVVPCGPVFHPTFQWLSGNGYFVLITTPRGAVGQGTAFADEHVNEWGAKSAPDLVEAVNWIATQEPAIDRDRMGAYSGSYGGVLAMVLAEMDTPFKALISEYGISNIASYWGAGYWGYLYGISALGGSYPWNAPEVYVQRSPLFQADKVKTPLLLMHGDSDVNVPVGESDQMFTALKVLGRDTAYVRFFDEDHGMKGKFSNWIAQEDFVIAWFDKYLKGQDDQWKYMVDKTLPKPEHKPMKDHFFYSEGDQP